MERRVLLAIFLSFLVLYGYQALFVPPTPPEDATSTASSSGEPSSAMPGAPGTATSGTPPGGAMPGTASPGTAAGSASATTTPGGTASAPDAAAPTAPEVPALVGEDAERDIRLETETVVAVFTNRGGRLKSWRLKKYLDPAGEPLELVPHDLGPAYALPFSLSVPDEALTRTINDALYTASTEPGDAGAERLRFEYANTAGLRVEKEFQLEPGSYVVSVRASATQQDNALAPAIQWGPALGGQSATGRYAVAARALLFANGEVQRLDSGDLAEQPLQEGDFGYAGVDNQYFVTVALDTGPAKVLYRPVTIAPPAGSEESPRTFVAYTLDRAQRDAPVRFFAGPKDFDVLASIDRDFVRAIDFGMFSIIVAPLLRSLKWINGYVGNYGWSIVLLTVIINAIMFPLRHKSVVSMRKMQEIQPEAKAIQERYAKLKATDPAKQKMNQELMALYRERGVNPASGCVPMLLTMPVLYAFYALLVTAIELRGAPFFGWIRDLSVYDPYYILPVAMGITQLWQMRIQPQTGADPAQQKLMMFMPLMFIFFFLWAPAGVALYWFVSNAWTIGQQYLTNYLIGPPNVRTVRAPAERRVRRVGSGKTDAAAREN